MECPRCHDQNADDSRFCGGCGSSLIRDVTCSSCGHSNPGGQKFCNRCGNRLGESAAPPERVPRAYTPKHLADKILTSRTALEGERKQVTVLFADVQRSMDLQQRMDPESWHGIIEPLLGLLAEGVHRFEGTVNQYTGDGIMALFGAPIAHEDHARRACYAALHLREHARAYAEEVKRSRGVSFGIRIGLNSGEVVVGKIGDDLRMDYTAQGFTASLADRMQQLADPGTVYVSDRTQRLVAGYFQVRDLGDFEILGGAEPIRVHELEGVGALRTRLDVSRARGFSRFVGRVDEMATLELALNRTQQGDGQVVGVVGQAGVGKSRLCLQFVEQCRARGIRVYEAHCPAHGKTVPLLPILELLRNAFAITAEDTDQAAREKIAGRLLLLDRAFDDVLPLVFGFLGVSDPEEPTPQMDPEARQRQLYGFLRRWVEATSDRESAILLFDDIQWIDEGSDAFLAQLVEATSGTRTLLLANFRPEYRAAWMGKSDYQQLPLSPLGPEAIDELLHELLGGDPTVAGLHDLICERTGGNPFFIEEVVQSLAESESLSGTRGAYRLVTPIAELAIPATVQAVLAARIDRLPEREKQVLQTAAVATVVDKRFSESLLGRVAGLPGVDLAAALSRLQADELIVEGALYPELEYVFKHPLTQSVAYDTQLSDRRAGIHAALAHALEEIHAEKLDEWAALLAHHSEEAREDLEAARWQLRAARWAGLHGSAKVLHHLRKILELLDGQAESDETIALGVEARGQLLALALRLGGMEAELPRLLEEGRALAARSRDPRTQFHFQRGAGTYRLMSAAAFEQVKERATPLQSLIGAAPRSLALLECGRAEEALATAEEAVTSVVGSGSRNAECEARVALATVLLRVGGPETHGRVEDELARAEAGIEETGYRMQQPRVHEVRAELARHRGDEAARGRELREAHRLFTEMGATGHAQRVGKELD